MARGTSVSPYRRARRVVPCGIISALIFVCHCLRSNCCTASFKKHTGATLHTHMKTGTVFSLSGWPKVRALVGAPPPFYWPSCRQRCFGVLLFLRFRHEEGASSRTRSDCIFTFLFHIFTHTLMYHPTGTCVV